MHVKILWVFLVISLGKGDSTIIFGLMLAFGKCGPQCCYVGDSEQEARGSADCCL